MEQTDYGTMSIPESENGTELLKTFSTSLKGILLSLEQLTAAVEGVAESIEKAHEPEGDLGVHLVASLKELTSVIQKRAQQERSSQPPQGNRQQNHTRQPVRREERQQKHHLNEGMDPEGPDHRGMDSENGQHGHPREHDLPRPEEAIPETEATETRNAEPRPTGASGRRSPRSGRRRRSGGNEQASSSGKS
jgi:hypothetical protein